MQDRRSPRSLIPGWMAPFLDSLRRPPPPARLPLRPAPFSSLAAGRRSGPRDGRGAWRARPHRLSPAEQQLRRWRNLDLTVDQKQDVARLEGQVLGLRRELTAILALAAEIRQGTIDRVMDKSDLELGLEVLLGIRPPP